MLIESNINNNMLSHVKNITFISATYLQYTQSMWVFL